MDLSRATRDDSAAMGNRLTRSKLRTVLVIGQVALSLALLTVASVLLRSASNANVMDLGFERDQLAIAQMGASQSGFTAARKQQFSNGYVERLASVVGDSNVARGSLPMTDFPTIRLNPKQSVKKHAFGIRTSDKFLDVMGVQLESGRAFTKAEVASSAPVVVVSASFARSMWPTVTPLGQRVEIADLVYSSKPDSMVNVREVTVVGVAEDAQFLGPGRAAAALMFMPSDSGDIVVRARKPEMVLNALRDAGRIEDADMLLKISTMNQYVNQSSRVQAAGVTAMYAGALGTLALALSLIGIFGVVAYAVSQRTREIGIRLAVGAQRADVLRMVIRQGMAPVFYGATVGLLLSAAATQGLRVMLFGIGTLDPAAFVGATVAVALAAGLACYLPARRATRIDPVGALRSE